MIRLSLAVLLLCASASPEGHGCYTAPPSAGESRLEVPPMPASVLLARIASGNLQPGAEAQIAHGLVVEGAGVAPNLVMPDRPTGIVVVSADATHVNLRNDGPAVAAANFLCERFYSALAPASTFGQVLWQGSSGSGASVANALSTEPTGTIIIGPAGAGGTLALAVAEQTNAGWPGNTFALEGARGVTGVDATAATQGGAVNISGGAGGGAEGAQAPSHGGEAALIGGAGGEHTDGTERGGTGGNAVVRGGEGALPGGGGGNVEVYGANGRAGNGALTVGNAGTVTIYGGAGAVCQDGDASAAGGAGAAVEVRGGAGGEGRDAKDAGAGGTLTLKGGAGGDQNDGGNGGSGGALVLEGGAAGAGLNAAPGVVQVGPAVADVIELGRSERAVVFKGLRADEQIAANVAAVGTQISPDAGFIILTNTSGGALVLTSTPTITPNTSGGYELPAGTRILIANVGAQPITLQGETSLAGSGLWLGAATRELQTGGLIELIRGSDGGWREVSFRSQSF